MLVLSRKQNESIVIDETITVRVLQTRPGRVRLGIEAPQEVSIRRLELPEEDQPEKLLLDTAEVLR